jgi:hypothetical protein
MKEQFLVHDVYGTRSVLVNSRPQAIKQAEIMCGKECLISSKDKVSSFLEGTVEGIFVFDSSKHSWFESALVRIIKVDKEIK